MATFDELWRAQMNPFPLGQRTPTPLEQQVSPGFGDVNAGASSTAITERPSVSPSVMAGLQNRAYQPTPEWLGQGGLPRSAAQMEQDLSARSFMDAANQQRMGEIENDAEANLLPIERALKRTQMEEAQYQAQRPQRIVKGANGTYTNEVSPYTRGQEADLGIFQRKAGVGGQMDIEKEIQREGRYKAAVADEDAAYQGALAMLRASGLDRETQQAKEKELEDRYNQRIDTLRTAAGLGARLSSGELYKGGM